MSDIFWVSLFLLFFGYLGYGLSLTVINLIRKKQAPSTSPVELPSVAFIVAAYNEEEIIEKKIHNSLSLNYPYNKIHFYFITDGSSDETYNICLKYKQIITHHLPVRMGKLAAIQRIIPHLSEDILVFSDANCMVNREAILNILPHYLQPGIGAVSGEKKIQKDGDAAASEGLYWKYESWLKKQDAQFYSIIGAAGELFSIKRELYTNIPDDLILDDFVQSMKVCEQGYLVKYEQNAYSIETASTDLKEEFKRKSRICAGAFQSFSHISFAFNPLKHPKIFYQFFFHRFFRWVLGPLLIFVLLISNILIIKEALVYKYVFIVQLGFYAMAIVGFICSLLKIRLGAFYIPLYFIMMNGAVFKGFFKYITNSQTTIWKKSKRKTTVNSENKASGIL